MNGTKLFLCCFLVIFASFSTFSETIARKNYESKRFKVQISAMENEPCQGTVRNMVEVAVLDKSKRDFWYEWFIIEGNKEYLFSEYNSNPDLNIAFSYNAGITDIDIDQFATEKMREIADVEKGFNKQNYTTVPHEDGSCSYFAYSRTPKDFMKIRGESWK